MLGGLGRLLDLIQELHVQRRRGRLAARAGRGQRRDRRLPARLPVHRRHRRLPRGRPRTSPAARSSPSPAASASASCWRPSCSACSTTTPRSPARRPGWSARRGGRPLVEMGSRRTHEEAAIAPARAAYVAGFASTSNLAAGRRYGIPTVGTAAHAFMLAHDSEEAAFRSQVEAQGTGTTLLVDTYDIADGIRTAVKVAGPGLGAIRIDSGDLAEESPQGAGAARRARRHRHPDHRHQRPRRVRDHRAAGRADRRLRRRHPPGHWVRTPDRGDGLQAGRRGGGSRTGRRCVRWPRSRPPRSRWAAASPRYRTYADDVLTDESFTLDDAASNVQVPAIRDGAVVHRPTLDEIREHSRRRDREPARRGARRLAGGPSSPSPTPKEKRHDRRHPRPAHRRRAERLRRGRLARRRRRPSRGHPDQRPPRGARRRLRVSGRLSRLARRRLEQRRALPRARHRAGLLDHLAGPLRVHRQRLRLRARARHRADHPSRPQGHGRAGVLRRSRACSTTAGPSPTCCASTA